MKAYVRLVFLALSLTLLAYLAGPWTSNREHDGGWQSTVSSIAVDGVQLGDSRDQVEACWGLLERLPSECDRLFLLPRVSSLQGRPGQYAEMDAEGRVQAVTGEALRLGSDLALKRGDYPDRALHVLGRPLREARVMGGIRDQVCLTFRKQGVLVDVIVPDNSARRRRQEPALPDSMKKITEITISYPPRGARSH